MANSRSTFFFFVGRGQKGEKTWKMFCSCTRTGIQRVNFVRQNTIVTGDKRKMSSRAPGSPCHYTQCWALPQCLPFPLFIVYVSGAVWEKDCYCRVTVYYTAVLSQLKKSNLNNNTDRKVHIQHGCYIYAHTVRNYIHTDVLAHLERCCRSNREMRWLI